LSLRELYGSYSEEMVGKLAEIVNQIIDQLDTDILLIPHVLSNAESDNDEIMLRKLKAFIPERIKDRVELAKTDRGFIGIKEQLHQCKFIVSARMHCAINAITEGVPAVFLSYSQKSQGMAKYVYGSNKWMLSIKKIDTDLIPMMKEMNNCWEETSNYLDKRIYEIKQEYRRLQEEQDLFNCCNHLLKAGTIHESR
jgi:polysaccharide pyruvyl transferase WcaK-like protein